MHYSPAQTHHTSDITVLRGYVDTIKARHGVSQREQAQAMGVGWTTYRDWLNGSAQWPKSAQLALANWADAPLEDDEDGIAARTQIGLSIEDERALIAAWKRVRGDDQSYNLATTIMDWPLDDLLAFARDGYRDAGFREGVRSQLLDEHGESLPIPQHGAETLYRQAYEWCVPAVLERLADLLEADD